MGDVAHVCVCHGVTSPEGVGGVTGCRVVSAESVWEAPGACMSGMPHSTTSTHNPCV